MNTAADTYRILCYGDSNTWGRSGASTHRYPITVRWTGILQQQLGTQYEVIEEGLRSRTTNLDDPDPDFPGRNGLQYLRPCLESHNPLDLVILWLGTNDLKTKYHRSAQDISDALQFLIQTMRDNATPNQNSITKILLVSPPIVDESALKAHSQFEGAEMKSKELGPLLELLAQKHCDAFVDLAQHVQPGTADGVHLDPASHTIVSTILNQTISELLPANA